MCRVAPQAKRLVFWAWASEQGISYAQLREANPWIRSTRLTVRAKTYTVRIPLDDDRRRSTQPVSVFNKAWVTDD